MAATPKYRAAGAICDGTGPVVVTWPDVLYADDYGVLFIETADNDASLSDAQGFTLIGRASEGTTRIAAYGCRATGGTMPSPTVADGGDHVVARIFTWSDVLKTGDPIDGTPATGSVAAGTTNVSMACPTTTVANAKVVGIASSAFDGTTTYSSAANASLAGVGLRSVGTPTTQGNGGSFGVWDGEKVAAGAVGNFTAVRTNNTAQATLAFALKPALESDTTVPTVTVRSPAPADGIRARSVVTLDVDDEAGLSSIVIIARIYDDDGVLIHEDVVHDGDDFGLHYQNDANLRTATATGYRFTVRRDDGWPGSPTFIYIVRDQAGNAAVVA